MFHILVLLILSGSIAYLGDRIGTKIGKKRLSVLGLRPKATAVLVTIVTGMGITIVTILTFALLNENVWDAIFNVPKLKASIKGLTTQVEDLRSSRAALEIQRAKLAEANALLKKEIEQSAERIKSLTEETQRLEKVNLENVRQIDDARANLEKLKRDSEDLRLEITRLEDELRRKSEGRLVFLRDTPILTAVLRPSRDMDGMLDQIKAALREARDVSVQRGAQAKEFRIFWEENRQAFEKLARDYYLQNTELAFGIISDVNIYKGDKLQLSIKAAPNELIVSSGDYVLPPDLPASLSQRPDDSEAIEGQLTYFYRRASYELYRKGRVQRIPEASPLELAKAIATINRMGGKGRVRVRAGEDIFAAGPAELTFDIEDQEKQAPPDTLEKVSLEPSSQPQPQLTPPSRLLMQGETYEQFPLRKSSGGLSMETAFPSILSPGENDLKSDEKSGNTPNSEGSSN
ncbi:MAG: hypothetical protein CVV64_06945 [Candidatus Wallbacteria bacterium HGW-Wallbacteria-1]|jgi:cell division protein FtsB|uniref:DUF3084 domain-containing protein n=1 Tax=Candidatus Wallbacteria bacterium HGW-Wallbacteria-1 TaxID=2013854 RepID=A0A2N1PT09_9BACT|nr:MAG: hypothetical protein CVV64_06945 [Candidatus Wallbacteria bacterium HGW-Wallbacteria-1]